MKITFLRLFVIQVLFGVIRSYTATLSINDSLKNFQSEEHFKNIEEAFESIIICQFREYVFYTLRLTTEIPNVISEEWNFFQRLNIRIEAVSEKMAEIYFSNSNAFILMNGNWSFSNIVFQVSNEILSGSALVLIKESLLIIKGGIFFDKIKVHQSRAFIFLMEFSKFEIYNTTISPYSFSGIFSAGVNNNIFIIKNLTLNSGAFQNGNLLFVRDATSSLGFLSDIKVEACKFLAFNILKISLSFLELTNLFISGCEFYKESSVLKVEGETFNSAIIKFCNIKKIYLQKNDYLNSDVISITENSGLFLLLSDVFIELNTFGNRGMILIQASIETTNKLEINNCQFSYSRYSYGIKFNVKNAVLFINTLTFLKNNKESNEINDILTGPCLFLTSIHTLNMRALLLIENYHVSDKVSGVFIENIISTGIIFIYQSIFHSNLANSVDSIGCSIFITTENSLILEINESIFENNTLSSLYHGGSALNILATLMNLKINLSKFIGNRALSFGNVINFNGDSLTIINSEFSQSRNILFKNYNLNSIPTTSIGIMSLKLNNFSILNASIFNNVGFLGNIYIKQQNAVVLSVSRINFYNNLAKLGNLLYIEERTDWLNVSINFCVFSGNINEMYGMVIFISLYHPVEIILVNIKNNIFKNESIFDDGYIYFVIYHGFGSIFIENCIFSEIKTGVNNSIVQLTGSLVVIHGLTNKLAIHINMCNFEKIESAGPYGNLMYAFKSIYEITNSYFQHHFQITSIFIIDDDSLFLIDGCYFVNVTGGYSALCLVRSSQLRLNNSNLYYLNSYYTLLETLSNGKLSYINTTLFKPNIIDRRWGAVFLLRNSVDNSCIISSSVFINIANIFLNCDNSIIILSHNIIYYTDSNIILISNCPNFTVLDFKIFNAYCESKEITIAGLLQAIESNISITNLFIDSYSLNGSCNLVLLSKGGFNISNSFIQNIISSNDNNYMILANYLDSIQIINLILNTFKSGFLSVRSSIVLIESSKFIGGIVFKTSAILIENCWLEFENSICSYFYSLYATSGCCLAFINTQTTNRNSPKLKVSNCSFFTNSAESGKGGAIYFSTNSASIINSIFQNNTALFGGAVYFFNDFQIENNTIGVYFDGNKFLDNKASSAGGAIYWDIIKPEILNSNEFLHNTAKVYGENVASPPIRMIIEIDGYEFSKESEFILTGLRPGAFPNTTLSVKLADAYYQTLRVDEGIISEMILLPSQYNIGLLGTNIGELDSNTKSFKFNKFSISANETRVWVYISFTSKLLVRIKEYTFLQITQLHKNENFSDGNYQVFLPVLLNECEIGEILLKEERECKPCPKGYFSFNFTDRSCRTCMRGANCTGGKNVILLPGFWRKHQLSDKVYICNRALRSCKGGYENLCADDFIGIKCEKCAPERREGIILQRTFSGNCTECMDILSLSICFIIIMVFSSLFSMLLTYIFQTPKISISSKMAIKSLISYFQYCLIMQSYESSIPIYIRDYLMYSGSLIRVGSMWFSIECFLKTINKDYVPHLETVTVQFACFLVGFFSYFYYYFLNLTLRKSKFRLPNADLRDFLMTSFYIFGPWLSDYLISFMMCEKIENDYFLKSNHGYSCSEAEYYIWISLFYVPSLILIMGCPFYFYNSRIKGSKNISLSFKKPSEKKNLGLSSSDKIIYRIGYNTDKILVQELYIYLQKILIISINQSPIDIEIKYPILLFILLSFLISFDALVIISRHRLFNFLDLSSKLSIISVTYLLLWISEDEMGNTGIEQQLQTKFSHEAIFTIMALFQFFNFLFHFAVIFGGILLKAKIFLSKLRRLKKNKIFNEAR